ncbi:MAG: DUF4864 domain-containing protein [Pseudomonadota bacterium]
MRALVILIALFVGLAAPAHADDTTAAQTIIRAQVDAFIRGDAAAAYSHAAPGIRGVFTQADVFVEMVAKNYPPIIRHKSFEFGKAEALSGGVAQAVRIVDDEGVPWQALYTLEKQPDGSWKITGCTLQKVGEAA